MRIPIPALILFAAAAAVVKPVTSPGWVGPSEPVSAALVVETGSIRPGAPFWAAVRLTMAPGWHVNWINPGDAGLAPRIDWKLPEGFIAGDTAWPYPQRHVLPELTIFGYEKEVILLARIEAPQKFAADTTVTVGATVTWLACREACVPGEASLSIDLPVTAAVPAADPESAAVFDKTRSMLPVRTGYWRVGARESRGGIVLTVEPSVDGAPDPGGVYFYPIEQGIIENSEPQKRSRSGSAFELAIPRARMGVELPSRLRGVLVSENGWDEEGHRALDLDVPVTRTSE